jgi:predicted YcjX-like family ATPase
MTEYNVETFIPEYSYKKSGFDYDPGGRLVKSLDLDANTSLEFFPKAGGLNVYTMHYNRFGTLEKSVKHYYTYYK